MHDPNLTVLMSNMMPKQYGFVHCVNLNTAYIYELRWVYWKPYANKLRQSDLLTEIIGTNLTGHTSGGQNYYTLP